MTCEDCKHFQSGRCTEEDEEGEICERFHPAEKGDNNDD